MKNKTIIAILSLSFLLICACKKREENLYGIWEIEFEEACRNRVKSQIWFKENSVAYLNHFYHDGSTYWEVNNLCKMEWSLEKKFLCNTYLRLSFPDSCSGFYYDWDTSNKISEIYEIKAWSETPITLKLKEISKENENSCGGDIFCSINISYGYLGATYSERTLYKIAD